MASAEAQKDFPDEKQRAAVAYSMFRERKNNTDLCRKCGAHVLVNADSFIQHCDLCGDRVMGRQTPALEKLPNICPFCQHPVAPEHDSFGCHVPGCSCAMTDAAVDDMIRAVLPNTASGLNAAGGVWDKADNARRVELLKQASIADSAGGMVHLTFSQIPDREQKQIARTLGFENKNANLSKLCRACFSGKTNEQIEGADAFLQDGVYHLLVSKNSDVAICGVKAIENKNSYPDSYFKHLPSKERAESQGIEDVEDGDLTEEGLRAKRAALAEGNENTNASSELAAIWDMAYQPSLERLLQKHGLDTDMANRKWKDLPQDVRSQVSQDLPSLHENSNASPDFQAAMAAFEAHCAACAECKAGSDAADVSKLCAEGSQLLVADLKNDGNGGISQASLGHQQATSTTAARPGKKDDIKNAGDKAEIRRKIAALKPLIEREKDTSSDKFKELVREAGRLGEELDKMENASDSSKDAEQIKRLAEGIEHEADEIAAQEPVLASSREATGAQRYGSACS